MTTELADLPLTDLITAGKVRLHLIQARHGVAEPEWIEYYALREIAAFNAVAAKRQEEERIALDRDAHALEWMNGIRKQIRLSNRKLADAITKWRRQFTLNKKKFVRGQLYRVLDGRSGPKTRAYKDLRDFFQIWEQHPAWREFLCEPPGSKRIVESLGRAVASQRRQALMEIARAKRT